MLTGLLKHVVPPPLQMVIGRLNCLLKAVADWMLTESADSVQTPQF